MMPELIRRSLGPRAEGAGARLAGDHSLNPEAERPRPEALRQAAVLLGLVERDGGLSVVLTKRTQHMRSHAGQVAFPGGRLEQGDPDLVACALRETEEEIGLGAAHIEVVGSLDVYTTGSGYAITPVVGFIRPGFTLVPDPEEVESIFEVPLSFLIDPANRQRHSTHYQGAERHYYAMPYGDYYIWGATAGILVNFADRLAGA